MSVEKSNHLPFNYLSKLYHEFGDGRLSEWRIVPAGRVLAYFYDGLNVEQVYDSFYNYDYETDRENPKVRCDQVYLAKDYDNDGFDKIICISNYYDFVVFYRTHDTLGYFPALLNEHSWANLVREDIAPYKEKVN